MLGVNDLGQAQGKLIEVVEVVEHVLVAHVDVRAEGDDAEGKEAAQGFNLAARDDEARLAGGTAGDAADVGE